jgi:hypothetical protein
VKQRQIVWNGVVLVLGVQTAGVAAYTADLFRPRGYEPLFVEAPLLSPLEPGEWSFPALDLEDSTSISKVISSLVASSSSS